MPAQPGRYYPAAGAGCFSWRLALESCVHVDTVVADRLAALPLRVFREEPTVLAELKHGTSSYTLPSNFAVAIELAFARTRSARAERPRACAWNLTARWSGPGAAARPARFCLGPAGVYAKGKLYALPAGIVDMRAPS